MLSVASVQQQIATTPSLRSLQALMTHPASGCTGKLSHREPQASGDVRPCMHPCCRRPKAVSEGPGRKMVKDSSMASLILIRLRSQEGEKRRTGAADGGGSRCRKGYECGSNGERVNGSKEVLPCQCTGPADHAVQCMRREAEIHGRSPRSSSEEGGKQGKMVYASWKTGNEWMGMLRGIQRRSLHVGVPSSRTANLLAYHLACK